MLIWRMHMKIHIFSLSTVAVFCTLAIGYLLGKIVHVPGYSLQKEISPVHAATAITPFLAAILISLWFNRESDKRKAEKSILLKRLDSGLELIDDIHEGIFAGNIELLRINTRNKRLNTIMRLIFIQLRLIRMNMGSIDIIEQQISEIHILMTNTPVQGGTAATNPPVRISRNVVYYNEARAAELEVKVDALKNSILKLQMEIIRN